MFGPGMFIFGFLIPLTAVVLVAYGIWELMRSREGSVAVGHQGSPASGSARAILDERFARGEIDADEYTSRRALLEGRSEPRTVASREADLEQPTSTITEPVEAVVNGEDAAVME